MNPQQQKNGQQPLPKQEVKAATAETPKLKDGKEIVLRKWPTDTRMYEILIREIRDGKIVREEPQGRPVDHKGVAAGRLTTVLSGAAL